MLSKAEETDVCAPATRASRKASEEAEDCCWICLSGSEEAMLVLPCSCPRPVHERCLARWQLQQAGRPEETKCRFCDTQLSDWKSSLTPDSLKPEVQKVQPIMVVYFEGEIHRIPVKQGPDGLTDFTTRIRELFRLPEEVDISLTFGCKEPMSGQHLKLEGIGAFDAAVHCASVAAAERKVKGSNPVCADTGSDAPDPLSANDDQLRQGIQTLMGESLPPHGHMTQLSPPPETRQSPMVQACDQGAVHAPDGRGQAIYSQLMPPTPAGADRVGGRVGGAFHPPPQLQTSTWAMSPRDWQGDLHRGMSRRTQSPTRMRHDLPPRRRWGMEPGEANSPHGQYTPRAVEGAWRDDQRHLHQHVTADEASAPAYSYPVVAATSPSPLPSRLPACSTRAAPTRNFTPLHHGNHSPRSSMAYSNQAAAAAARTADALHPGGRLAMHEYQSLYSMLSNDQPFFPTSAAAHSAPLPVTMEQQQQQAYSHSVGGPHVLHMPPQLQPLSQHLQAVSAYDATYGGMAAYHASMHQAHIQAAHMHAMHTLHHMGPMPGPAPGPAALHPADATPGLTPPLDTPFAHAHPLGPGPGLHAVSFHGPQALPPPYYNCMAHGACYSPPGYVAAYPAPSASGMYPAHLLPSTPPATASDPLARLKCSLKSFSKRVVRSLHMRAPMAADQPLLLPHPCPLTRGMQAGALSTPYDSMSGAPTPTSHTPSSQVSLSVEEPCPSLLSEGQEAEEEGEEELMLVVPGGHLDSCSGAPCLQAPLPMSLDSPANLHMYTQAAHSERLLCAPCAAPSAAAGGH